MKVHWHRSMKQLTLKSGILLTLGVAIIALVGYNMRDRILGTPLVVRTADNGATLTSAFLPITGSARHARELLINGRSITIDRHGAFTDEIVLSPGYNIVEVSLTDQFGSHKTKTYQVVFDAPQAVATVEHAPYQ